MMDTVVQQQTSMQRTLDTLVDLVGSWVTVHPSQSGPSTAPVPPAEDAPNPNSTAVPAPATTFAPAANPDPTPPGDELINGIVINVDTSEIDDEEEENDDDDDNDEDEDEDEDDNEDSDFDDG
ncbi:trigger factor-like [Zingiber officinale]|uniref:trigger factor-like n=1 Tax=Zingiber officinale TaxID=94328 RepID=UPI001C4B61EC|nr:trigger factor-like [Zingiber officinale]